MEQTLTFGDATINKESFHKNKKAIKLNDINVNNIAMCNNFNANKSKIDNSITKHFIGYKVNNKIKPLCINLPQMNGDVKYFDSGKVMNLIIDDAKHYKSMWSKIKELEKKDIKKFHSIVLYEDKNLKTKIKEYDGRITTKFNNRKILNDDGYYSCLAGIVIDSILTIDSKKYPQVFLEKFVYREKKSKIKRIAVKLMDSDSDDNN